MVMSGGGRDGTRIYALRR